MKTIIFYPERKKLNLKSYKITSSKDQGVYKKGEFIHNVKTDDINKLNQDGQYEFIATEIK